MGLTFSRDSDQFLLDAYTGQGGFLNGAYLVRHGRESDTKFQERQALAEYPNYVGKIVNIYSGFLFREQPKRETSDTYAAFSRDVDGTGAGLTIDLGMLGYQRLAMAVGTLYIIVDKPKQPGRLPYLAVRFPREVQRWEMDGKGRLTLITFSERVQLSSTEAVVQFRTFTETDWRVHSDANGGGIVEQGEHGLGRVPVVRLHSTIPLLTTDLRAKAWAHGLAQANWSLFNQLSEMRELFRKQTFSILALPVTSDEEAQRLSNLTISTENALTYNPTGGGKPSYIAPPADPVRLYQEAIGKTIERIYELSNLNFVAGVRSSGVAMKYEFQQLNQALVDLAMLTERAETEIASLVAAWQNEAWLGMISYPRNFDVRDLAADLQEALDAQTLSISPTFEQEQKKRLARQMLGHTVSQATMEQIDAEIEGGADPYQGRIKVEGTPPATTTGATQ